MKDQEILFFFLEKIGKGDKQVVWKMKEGDDSPSLLRFGGSRVLHSVFKF